VSTRAEVASFARRHIGPSPAEQQTMLHAVGAPSLEALAAEIVPPDIRLDAPLALPPAESEHAYLTRLGDIAARNQVFRSYIGLGYHDTITPSVIRRMILENPGWYTPYTPYQSEIAQGRLEALLTFQTMVTDLTAMEVANASLLDEATAAAEAMALLLRVRKPAPAAGTPVLLVADTCLPQTIAVLRGRAEPLGIQLRIGPLDGLSFAPAVFGLVVQSPDVNGALIDLAPIVARAHEAGAGARDTAGGDGRRRRLRQLAALRCAARVRRAARGVLRHAAGLRPAPAGAAHRRLDRRARTAGVPHGAGHS
jgi:glycine dehydrogenase